MKDNVKRDIKKLEDYERYYSHVQYCRNCGQKNVAYIKKGVRVTGNSIECEKCGCDINLVS